MTAPVAETRPATSVWSMYRAIVGIGNDGRFRERKDCVTKDWSWFSCSSPFWEIAPVRRISSRSTFRGARAATALDRSTLP